MITYRLYVYNTISAILPPTRLFAIKRALLRWAGASIGKDVRIVSSARFWLTGPLTIGDNTWIGHEVLIAGGDAPILIGKNVDIGPRVSLISGTHEPFGMPGKAAGEGASRPIEIGDGTWICAIATVLGGVKLGSRCLVAAAALVRTDVEDGQIVAGVPARPTTRAANC